MDSASPGLKAIAEFFYHALDKNSETRAVALDVLKAFDSLLHAGLLHKLKGLLE